MQDIEMYRKMRTLCVIKIAVLSNILVTFYMRLFARWQRSSVVKQRRRGRRATWAACTWHPNIERAGQCPPPQLCFNTV